MPPDLVLIDTSAWIMALGRVNLPAVKEKIGKTIPYTDIIIAAAALQAGALLLHADFHFDVIAESTGLAVESLVSLVQKQKPS